MHAGSGAADRAIEERGQLTLSFHLESIEYRTAIRRNGERTHLIRWRSVDCDGSGFGRWDIKEHNSDFKELLMRGRKQRH